MLLNFNHLYYFHVVVTEGGISPASRKLSLSQPTLSVQIKHLEGVLGKPLFTRTGNRLKLTPFGSMVHGYSSEMFAAATRLVDEIQEKTRSSAASLRLGVAEDIERPFSVRLVRLFLDGFLKSARPRVTLGAGEHETLLQQLRSGDLDALLTDHAAPDLVSLGAYEMPVVMAVAPDRESEAVQRFERAVQSGASLRGAWDMGLVVPSPKLRLRGETDDFLTHQGILAPVVFESDLLASVVRAVVDGVGVGFLPLPYVLDAVAQGKLQVFGPEPGLWSHSLWLLATRSTASHKLSDLKSAFQLLTREITAYRRAA